MSFAQSIPENPTSDPNQAASLAHQSTSQSQGNLPKNPYIGPLSFKTGQRLYGRDRELHQLTNLIVAERVLLLHSPSGAGKTSLIQAALIPRLITLRFQVMPIIRINRESMDAQDAEGNKIDCNRYCFSTLLSLEQAYSPEEQLPLAQLAQTSLADYLNLRQGPEYTAATVFIFDQFEEILTQDPTDLSAKQEFFRQIGEVLESPRRWGLFSMREDYVAALSPYNINLPGRLATTFRLELLDQNAALQAMIQPAVQAGVRFDELAAKKLVDDLRRVRVQHSDGTLDLQLGPSIEPVQLQVVCHRLWSIPRPDSLQITPQDLVTLGDVDDVLGAYYASTVAQVALDVNLRGVNERSVREWFDRQLITEQGVRSSVLMGTEKSGGLDNRAVRLLVNAYLVRSENRSGIIWFELAHDRLIAPIRENNADWFKANLNVLQQQADLWDRQGRSENLLMRGQDLEQALERLEDSPIELLPSEQDFINASKKQASRANRMKRRNQIIYILAIVSIILTFVALFAYRQAIEQRAYAQQQAQAALAEQLAAQAESALQDSPMRAMLLAVESVNQDSTQPSTEEALRAVLEFPHGQVLTGHQGAVNILAFSPDGHWLATGSDDSTIQLQDMTADPTDSPLVLSGHSGPVTTLAFSPDGHWLATAGKDKTIRMWDMRASNPGENPLSLPGHRFEINSLAFSPDSKHLASGTVQGDILVWDLTASSPAANPTPLAGESTIFALAFSPDGLWLASTSERDAVLWNMRQSDPSVRPITLSGHTGLVITLAFSQDGHWLATGSRDKTARLWDLTSNRSAIQSQILSMHDDWVDTLAFSPDGHWLATGSRDRTAILWDVTSADPNENPTFLFGHTGWINQVAFSPDGSWLATSSEDKTARIWDTYEVDPSYTAVVLRGHEDKLSTLAFSPDGNLLATGSLDKTARLWNVYNRDPAVNPVVLDSAYDFISGLIYNADGSWLAATGGDSSKDPRPSETVLWNTHAAGFNSPNNHFVPSGVIYPVYLDGNESWTKTSAFSPDGQQIAAAGGDGIIRIWDVRQIDPDNPPAPMTLSGHQGFIWSLAYSPKGGWLASGSEDGEARLWNLQVPDPAKSPFILSHAERVNQVAFSPDGHWLATASGNDAFLWDMDAQDPSAKSIPLLGHADRISSIAFSPDGHWLATASSDKTARLWDLHAADPAAQPLTLPGHSDWVTAVAFSPDNNWLATASRDKTARLWDLRESSPADNSKPLRGHNEDVTSLEFSHHSQILATASKDGTVRLWRLDSAAPERYSTVLMSHAKNVTAMAFSPDDRWLSVATEDFVIRLWLIPIDELISTACQSAGRNLTLEEWHQYLPDKDYHITCEQWPAPSLP